MTLSVHKIFIFKITFYLIKKIKTKLIDNYCIIIHINSVISKYISFLIGIK